MGKSQVVPIRREGKIDIHKRKYKFQHSLAKLEGDSTINRENKKLILDFIRECTLGKTIKGRSKKKIGPARCLKYLGILQQLAKTFGKSFHKITQEDMENYIQKLEDDSIESSKGKPYSDATKADIKKAIKKFWKWKDGNSRTYPELVEWIDTCVALRDVPALSRSEIETMIYHTANPRDRALLTVLFDSGARIEELLNVRLKKEHLFWREDLGCYMIRLEFSKTRPRTISIPLSTRYINDWLQVHPAKDNPQAQLFPIEYANAKMIIGRIGRRALNKRATPHILRHSSATFYANKIKNPYKLCYRYGWTMASREVNRYLDREGILEEETPMVVKADEISTANKQNQALQEELSLVKESHSELVAQFEKLSQELDDIRGGKGFMTLLMALTKQHEEMSRVLEEISGKKFDVVLPSKLVEDSRFEGEKRHSRECV